MSSLLTPGVRMLSLMSSEPEASNQAAANWVPGKMTPVRHGPPEAWLEHLERVTNELLVLARYRATWRPMNELAATSAAIQEQPYFVQWVSELYATTMAVGVRKLADRSRGTASLYRLLESIARHPEGVTREWYLSDIFEDWVPDFDADFSERADPEHLNHIDPRIVRADQSRLLEESEFIRRYVNQYLAHVQAEPSAEIPTFSDLHGALDALIEVFLKYEQLLTRAHRSPFEPVFQFPWERIFDQPWRLKGLPTES